MHKHFIKYLPAVFMFIIPARIFAQADIHFSQFYETTILRNPALTGIFSDNYKVDGIYRNQWSSVTNPYETYLVDAQYRFSIGRSDFLSVGLLAYSDMAGDLDQKITGVYPAINYNKSLGVDNYSYLSVGFTGGYIQYSLDPSKATFNNQFVGGFFNPGNPTYENIPRSQMTVMDMGAGINFNISPGTSKDVTYMIGFSGYHFNTPEFSYYSTSTVTQDIRWNINAGILRALNDNVVLQLHANFAQQGNYNEMIGGGLIGWRTFAVETPSVFEIYGGLMYRLNDAVIPVVKLKYKNLSVGVSYDVNVSTLQPASNMQGGLEVSLSVSGQYPPSRDYKSTVCPRF